MADDGFVTVLLLGGGALALWALLRKGDSSPGPDAIASGSGGGEGAAQALPTGYDGGYSFFDPATGLPVDPQDVGFTGVVGPDGVRHDLAGPPPQLTTETPFNFTPQFSPEFEAALLKQNEDANREALRQSEETNRRLAEEAARQTRAANLETALVGGASVALAAPSLIRVAQAAPSLIRTAQASLSLSAPLRTALTPGPIAVGVGLGLAATAGLDKAGYFDYLQNQVAPNTIAKTPEPVQEAVKTVFIPASAVGAVATGLVGRGDVGSNLQDAVRGTYLDRGIKYVQNWKPPRVVSGRR